MSFKTSWKKKQRKWIVTRTDVVERLLQANNYLLIMRPWAQEQIGTPLSWLSCTYIFLFYLRNMRWLSPHGHTHSIPDSSPSSWQGRRNEWIPAWRVGWWARLTSLWARGPYHENYTNVFKQGITVRKFIHKDSVFTHMISYICWLYISKGFLFVCCLFVLILSPLSIIQSTWIWCELT